MPTNEYYKRGIKIPLTVGASVATRTPMCVGKLPVVTLQATGSSGTQIATCLARGVVDVVVDSACDAVTLALSGVTAAQTLIFNGYTITAHGTVNTWSTRTISIAGTDAQDATLVAKAVNGGQIITLASVAAGEKIVVAGLTFTAHTSTTTASAREFSISGADAADATELAAVLNDATYGIVPLGYIATAGGAAEVLIDQRRRRDSRHRLDAASLRPECHGHRLERDRHGPLERGHLGRHRHRVWCQRDGGSLGHRRP
jgi:hypothetical protein